MNILPEIPKEQLECFKVNVKEWLDIDEQIKTLENKTKELKATRNKMLEPKITGFMRSFNISDLNTPVGKLRCNERNTKTAISKKTIKESLEKILTTTEQVDTAMDEIYLNRQVITKYTLSRVNK